LARNSASRQETGRAAPGRLVVRSNDPRRPTRSDLSPSRKACRPAAGAAWSPKRFAPATLGQGRQGDERRDRLALSALAPVPAHHPVFPLAESLNARRSMPAPACGTARAAARSLVRRRLFRRWSACTEDCSPAWATRRSGFRDPAAGARGGLRQNAGRLRRPATTSDCGPGRRHRARAARECTRWRPLRAVLLASASAAPTWTEAARGRCHRRLSA